MYNAAAAAAAAAVAAERDDEKRGPIEGPPRPRPPTIIVCVCSFFIVQVCQVAKFSAQKIQSH